MLNNGISYLASFDSGFDKVLEKLEGRVYILTDSKRREIEKILVVPFNLIKTYLIIFFLNFIQSILVSLNFTIPKNDVINKIFASPTYERFLRAEFFRILNKNGFCAISECSSIDLKG
jgi:hypothetical protein